MQHVPSSNGELYYLRVLLTKVRGPQEYKDIKTYVGIEYDKFRDYCFARDLLDDDTEFIDAIKEAGFWGSGYELRLLFVTMLLSNTLSRPDYVWKQTWALLSEVIVYMQRRSMGCPGKIFLIVM